MEELRAEGTNFFLLSLSTLPRVQESLGEVCNEVGIAHINAIDSMDVLENLLDHDVDLIAFHTQVGEDAIINTIDMIQRDDHYKTIPIIVISDLKINEELSHALSTYPVIAIFAYKNWKFQVKNLLELLRSKMEHADDLHDNLAQTKKSIFIDPLTGALNRRGGEKAFESSVGYYASNHEPFSLIIFDIDFFKKVNDTYGHNIGDEVLVHISSIIKDEIRKDDVLVRFGGEEFFVLLSNCNIDIAKAKAEGFRQKVEAASYSSHKLSVTASFGVVAYSQGSTLEHLMDQADTLLYKAKAGGRNQVCFA